MKNKNGRANNARLKHKYVEELFKADGNSDDTVKKKEASIGLFEKFIEYQDFGVYNKTIGENYQIEIKSRTNKQGSSISLKTVGFHLDALKKFLTWVRTQTGYRTKIIERDIDYLSLSKKERNQIRSQKLLPDLPDVNDVKKQIDLIPKETEIDLRDRAIFAFLMCTGIRAEALITLPIMSFNPDSFFINQDPELGVKTKNSEHIISRYFNRDSSFRNEFLDWYWFLRNEKKYEQHLPLFPKNDQSKEGNSALFSNNKVSKEFWQSQSSLTGMMTKRNDCDVVNYFSPHLYRHSTILHATDKCISPGEFKAVSQNFGHRDVMTTLMTYGNLPARVVMEKMQIIDERDLEKINNILRNINSLNSGTTNNSDGSFLNDMIRLLESHGFIVSSGENSITKTVTDEKKKV
ncbi:MAG: site-specific integrase [Nitrosopumilus sp.]